MTSNQNRDKLLEYVGDMVALERHTEETLEQAVEDAETHPIVARVVTRFRDMVRAQLVALRKRFETLGGREPDSKKTMASFPSAPGVGTWRKGQVRPVSRTLHNLHTAFNHAALGYAVLHAVAHRFYDSQDEGNTADLAEQHMRGYAAAIQEINQLISDAVVWELGEDGYECQCLCPSCSLGLCLCSPHGTNTVNQAWRETSPAAPEGGIRVRRPRRDSAAADADLHDGDIILAVDDEEIRSNLDTQTLQAGVRKHKSGEEIRFRVRRGGNEPQVIALTRP